MGVSASGKTTIAKMLAAELKIDYVEADDFHSQENKEKMKNGIPLTDEDRTPWLLALHKEALTYVTENKSMVMACSALKEKYRELLSSGIGKNVRIIYLKGSYDMLYRRIKNRRYHYMPAELLKSQFDTLEEPQNAITVDASGTPEETLAKVLNQLANAS